MRDSLVGTATSRSVSRSETSSYSNHQMTLQATLDLARRRGISLSPPVRARDDGVVAAAPRARTSGDSLTDGPGKATRFDDLIRAAAAREGVDAGLVRAVVQAESNFDPNAVSSAGAKGLMQLMDGTARELGVTNTLDPVQNVVGGTRYLKQMLTRYGGDVRSALAAYNAGPGAVDAHGGVPPYRETQAYVSRILTLRDRSQ